MTHIYDEHTQQDERKNKGKNKNQVRAGARQPLLSHERRGGLRHSTAPPHPGLLRRPAGSSEPACAGAMSGWWDASPAGGRGRDREAGTPPPAAPPAASSASKGRPATPAARSGGGAAAAPGRERRSTASSTPRRASTRNGQPRLLAACHRRCKSMLSW